ncbi:MAG TPA: VOC family protein [Lacunisphaera sp.]|nr:VOC family protein [Lacunisphaera sp.]
MTIPARFAHTNLVARDWRRLARFYHEVFGCTPASPERDLRGDWLDRVTGLDGARLRGIHLLLPGHGPGGPTLEIFSYDAMPAASEPRANQPGFAHIAFAVPDVAAALAAVRAGGGSAVGDLVRHDYPGLGQLEVVYARDPEGNIVELQRWT